MTDRLVEYQPPAPDVLEDFAQRVGYGLGGQYAEPEIKRGLAEFMKTIARVCAKKQNRTQCE